MQPTEAATPTVSVVVPTYNRATRLVRLLRALATQAEPPDFEVVVADDGSTDDTVARAMAMTSSLSYALTVISGANRGPGPARNRGWRTSTGGLILFIDDDCVPDPHWVVRMVHGLHGADVVVGRTQPPCDQRHHIGPFSRYIDIDSSDGFLTCNIGYRRAVLEALEGFDEDEFPVRIGEDTDLGMRARRAGYQDRFVADAKVWHDVHPSSFRSHVREIGHFEGFHALVARHPEARSQALHVGWFLRSVDKAILICWGAAALVALRPRRPATWVLAGAAAGTYLWQFGRSHYRPRSRMEWLTSVPLAFVADNWAVVIMIRGSVRHRTILL